jgi:hypothetical protein
MNPRLMILAFLAPLLGACGADVNPALHVGRLEMAYAEILHQLRNIRDRPGAERAVGSIRAAYDRIRKDREIVRSLEKGRLTPELTKRIEELGGKQMASIMTTILQLPPALKPYVSGELANLDFSL